MYRELLDKNLKFISQQKCYRSYDTQTNSLTELLNEKKIVTISWLRHSWKTKLIYSLLSKTQNFSSTFYYNSELDTLGVIQNGDDFIILFDLYVRIHGIPKIIVLQNTNNIVGIKSLISRFFKTKKYKIIVVGNNIKIESVPDIELFPLGITESIEKSFYGWIPEVRVIPDFEYKDFLLTALKHDIISRDILESYSIKNIALFYKVIWYLAQSREYQSLREIHRNLKAHHIDISLLTLIDYINAALNTKFLSKCHRYDIKNSNTISSKAQYFFGDVWLRKSFTHESIDLTENLLYIELLSKWYSVSGWINGKFTFDFYAQKDNKILAIHLDNSWEKWEIRKSARKLAKLWDKIDKYVVVTNKNSLTMRKFEESWVQIVELLELVEKI